MAFKLAGRLDNTGIGVAGAATLGILLLGEAATPGRLFFLALLLVAGGAGLRIQQHNPATRLCGQLCNAPAHGASAHHTYHRKLNCHSVIMAVAWSIGSVQESGAYFEKKCEFS